MALAVASAAVVSLTLGTGTAAAALDNTTSIVDVSGLTIEARQSDTDIKFVQPLDGNPLTREWFHSGTAGFRIAGADADKFAGGIVLGYQIGYPATMTGQMRFNYSTPSFGVSLGSEGISLGNLIPTVGVELAAGFGPGIQTVNVAQAGIAGSDGSIRISGFHGAVSGVLGEVSIRPFVTVTSSKGDSVTTYGNTWKI
ncbi:MAG: MspA family porin [Aldersonia sp.]|nr:MspA family porin [Aldersonia sp.]